MNYKVSSELELSSISTKILDQYKSEKYFAFYGEMGVGKTTTVKAFCKVLNVLDVVSSPTFSIVNEYQTSVEELVYHFDFYRLESEREALDIGWEDYLSQADFCFIEWPERIEKILPERFVKITILVKDGERHFLTEIIGG